MEQRLQKILAKAGVCSRRKAEEYIKKGRVKVDGQIMTKMGLKIDPARHRIEFDSVAIEAPEKKTYILLNKPTGYVTTLSDPQGRPIVTSLLKNIQTRIFPVGRLDQDTEGALLLTNDGEMTQRILHPSFEIHKTYVASVKGIPSRKKVQSLESGIMLEGKKTSPARLKVFNSGQQTTSIEITIHEGRKRQVRKMFKAIGHPVLELKRISYGKLKLGGLASGKYRFLNKADLEQIFL